MQILRTGVEMGETKHAPGKNANIVESERKSFIIADE